MHRGSSAGWVAAGVAALGLAYGAGCGKHTATGVPSGSASTGPSAAAEASAAPSDSTTAADGSLGKPQTSAKKPAPPPPPQLTEADAQKIMGGLAKELQARTKVDCRRYLDVFIAAQRLVGPTNDEAKLAYYGAALCAEEQKLYGGMLGLAKALDAADPSFQKLALVPRAHIRMKHPQEAAKALKALGASYAKEPAVMFTALLLFKEQRMWSWLVQGAEEVVKVLAASSDPKAKGRVWEAQMTRFAGLMNSGELEQGEGALAEAAKSGAPAPLVQSLRKRLIPVKANRVYVDADVPDDIYLGTYHLYGKTDAVGDLFTVEVTNYTGKDQQMKLEIEIPGVTDRFVKNLNVLDKGQEVVEVTPPLRADFHPSAQQAERNSQVSIKVTLPGENGKVVYEDSLEVKVFPRDQLPMAMDPNFVAAWVTPQAPEVEELMTAAKKRAPGGSLEGRLGATVPQVKALYEELKARGMSYVLVTNFGAGLAQHARLPADTIRSTNALCLDGTILFAALLEKLGLEPLMVRVPGHIFVGWKPSDADEAPAGTLYFLETTMVGSASFEDAMKMGTLETQRSKQKKQFETGQAHLIDLMKLRAAGYTPQPWG